MKTAITPRTALATHCNKIGIRSPRNQTSPDLKGIETLPTYFYWLFLVRTKPALIILLAVLVGKLAITGKAKSDLYHLFFNSSVIQNMQLMCKGGL